MKFFSFFFFIGIATVCYHLYTYYRRPSVPLSLWYYIIFSKLKNVKLMNVCNVTISSAERVVNIFCIFMVFKLCAILRTSWLSTNFSTIINVFSQLETVVNIEFSQFAISTMASTYSNAHTHMHTHTRTTRYNQ